MSTENVLSGEERAAIEEALAQYEEPRAACVEALVVVQSRRGWVDDECLRGVAAMLGMSAHELDGIATFYNLVYRRPVGRHVIHVCDSVSCWLAGGEEIRARIEAKLGIRPGATTGDGRFTLLPIVCLGACDRAPAMLVDGDLHGELDARRVDEILEDYA